MILQIFKSMFSCISNWIIVVVISVMTIPLCALLGDVGFIIINGFLTSLAFMLLCYQTSWKRGWSDVNYLKLHNINFTPVKGFLIPCIPFFVGIILFVCYLLTKSTIIWLVFYGSTMYLSGFMRMFPNAYPYVYALVMLVTCTVSTVAYILGHKRISLSINLMYKKDKKK